jgi:hypothetical protein
MRIGEIGRRYYGRKSLLRMGLAVLLRINGNRDLRIRWSRVRAPRPTIKPYSVG